MTLNEAIKHCYEVADREEKKADAMYPPTIELDDRYDSCRECAADHRQLAGWLEELKEFRAGKVCRPHGTWIEDVTDEQYMVRHGWKCSVCGKRQTFGTPNYCMMCGARMEGENNE